MFMLKIKGGKSLYANHLQSEENVTDLNEIYFLVRLQSQDKTAGSSGDS